MKIIKILFIIFLSTGFLELKSDEKNEELQKMIKNQKKA